MIYPVRPNLRCLLTLLGLGLSSLLATAAEWPQDFVVAENSTSPDGRYAVLIPTSNAVEQATTNYLVDPNGQKLLGKIQGADYFQRDNHRGFSVVWADDSTWCTVEYDNRFGFESLSVLEMTEQGFRQTAIGSRIQKAVGDGPATLCCQPRADRKLKVNALMTTNPKEIEGQKSLYALFLGTYDVGSRKWSTAAARNLSANEYNTLSLAFGYPSGKALDSVESVEESAQAEQLDQRLNQVYQALRVLLPADRFAKLKQEQIAWLKTRDAEQSAPAKLKLVGSRIDALNKLLP